MNDSMRVHTREDRRLIGSNARKHNTTATCSHFISSAVWLGRKHIYADYFVFVVLAIQPFYSGWQLASLQFG